MVSMIYGRSGSGKSRSMKGLDPNNTLLINVQNKPLPFRGGIAKTFVPKGEHGVADQIQSVIGKTLVKYPETNVIVIDDCGYIMTKAFMSRQKNMSGSAVFDLYNDIANDMWKLANYCNSLPDHVNTYFMMHEESSDFGEIKLKTIGRQLDQRVCYEGMFTVCLRCMTDGKEHWFSTQNTGNDVSKSPEDMFPNIKIENDLGLVDKAIRKYYEIAETQVQAS